MIELTRLPPDTFQRLVLILIDSEGKCPKKLEPELVAWANEARSDADIACVLPHPMFETWFVAAASSLAGNSGFPADLTVPDDPEGNKLGKGWIKKKLSRKYSETADQPRFAAKIDLALCRQNSPSFDKLCRELEKRLPALTASILRGRRYSDEQFLNGLQWFTHSSPREELAALVSLSAL